MVSGQVVVVVVVVFVCVCAYLTIEYLLTLQTYSKIVVLRCYLQRMMLNGMMLNRRVSFSMVKVRKGQWGG